MSGRVAHGDVDGRRFVGPARRGSDGERVGELERRVERQVERAQQIEPRAVAIVARRDELRARGRELRLRARHVEPDADAGRELIARDAEQVGGERRVGECAPARAASLRSART